jgi:hypothetical protein
MGIIPLIALLAGMVVSYFQYYVLISRKMLASAKSNAAQTYLSSLLNEVTAQWLSPFGQLKIIFIILAVIGGWNLWKKTSNTFSYSIHFAWTNYCGGFWI